MAHPPSPCYRPTPEELLPGFRTYFSRPRLQAWLRAYRAATPDAPALYWRCLTPLVVLWGLVLQRLRPDHRGDAVVSHLQTGAADALDPADPHPQPLSYRLRSESTSAWTQARARLPLALLQWALRHVVAEVQAAVAPAVTWHGHAVRLLDGTTFRLAPRPELVATYGQARNQHGDGYWVVVRSVAAFCLQTHLCTAVTEAAPSTSESALVRPVMAADAPDTVFVGDLNFGVYRVAQVATALGQSVVLRLRGDRARALLRANGQRGPHGRAQTWAVRWARGAAIQADPTLADDPVAGRVVYVRLEQAGFRPKELYLFTTLPAAAPYTVAEVVALYGRRWEVEVDYRHIKTTLDMAEFGAQSPAVFRLELTAGLLTYNLVRAVMGQAAQQAGLAATRLSFAKCLRRLRDALVEGVPAWVAATGRVLEHLLTRLARCRLAHQPQKVRHEPRQVRRRPQVFPALKGTRAAARDEARRQVGAVDVGVTATRRPTQPAQPQQKAA